MKQTAVLALLCGILVAGCALAWPSFRILHGRTQGEAQALRVFTHLHDLARGQLNRAQALTEESWLASSQELWNTSPNLLAFVVRAGDGSLLQAYPADSGYFNQDVLPLQVAPGSYRVFRAPSFSTSSLSAGLANSLRIEALFVTVSQALVFRALLESLLGLLLFSLIITTILLVSPGPASPRHADGVAASTPRPLRKQPQSLSPVAEPPATESPVAEPPATEPPENGSPRAESPTSKPVSEQPDVSVLSIEIEELEEALEPLGTELANLEAEDDALDLELAALDDFEDEMYLEVDEQDFGFMDAEDEQEAVEELEAELIEDLTEEPVDMEAVDMEPIDMEPIDMEPIDMEPVDMEPLEAAEDGLTIAEPVSPLDLVATANQPGPVTGPDEQASWTEAGPNPQAKRIIVDEEEIRGPPGLYDPDSGLCWESYLRERLGAELRRAATFEQDLVLLLAVWDDAEKGSENYQLFTKTVQDFFNFKDLSFVFGEQGMAIVLPNQDIDQAVRNTEELIKKLTFVLQGKNRGLQYLELFMGLSSRSGRIVDADRLIAEALVAMKKARAERDTHIMAFRPDPEKFRSFLTSH